MELTLTMLIMNKGKKNPVKVLIPVEAPEKVYHKTIKGYNKCR